MKRVRLMDDSNRGEHADAEQQSTRSMIEAEADGEARKDPPSLQPGPTVWTPMSQPVVSVLPVSVLPFIGFPGLQNLAWCSTVQHAGGTLEDVGGASSAAANLPMAALFTAADTSNHSASCAKRRGPMTQMRQLMRIMAVVFPQVKVHNSFKEPDNRVSESSIRAAFEFLCSAGAPSPPWGVPNGWTVYLASLFEWVTGRAVPLEEVSKCVGRRSGRPWTADVMRLEELLGDNPHAWPIPFTRQTPASVPSMSGPSTAVSLAYDIKRLRTLIEQAGPPQTPEDTEEWSKIRDIANHVLTNASAND